MVESGANPSEWVHPSDVIGAIIPLAEYLSRVRLERGLPSLTMRDVIVSTIKAYEVLGILVGLAALRYYCAVKTYSVDDSQSGPCNHSDTPGSANPRFWRWRTA